MSIAGTKLKHGFKNNCVACVTTGASGDVFGWMNTWIKGPQGGPKQLGVCFKHIRQLCIKPLKPGFVCDEVRYIAEVQKTTDLIEQGVSCKHCSKTCGCKTKECQTRCKCDPNERETIVDTANNWHEQQLGCTKDGDPKYIWVPTQGGSFYPRGGLRAILGIGTKPGEGLGMTIPRWMLVDRQPVPMTEEDRMVVWSRAGKPMLNECKCTACKPKCKCCQRTCKHDGYKTRTKKNPWHCGMCCCTDVKAPVYKKVWPLEDQPLKV